MSSFKDFVKQRRSSAAARPAAAPKRAPPPAAAPTPAAAPPPAAAAAAGAPTRPVDAKAALVSRMVPSLMAAMQVLKDDPGALVAGPVEEAGQSYVLYCSAARTCLGDRAPANADLGGLEMPFFDFGNVRFRGDERGLPAAGTVAARLPPEAPPPPGTLAVFVHPRAAARAIERRGRRTAGAGSRPRSGACATTAARRRATRTSGAAAGSCRRRGARVRATRGRAADARA